MIASIMYWTGAICMLLMVASFGLGYLAYQYFEGGSDGKNEHS